MEISRNYLNIHVHHVQCNYNSLVLFSQKSSIKKGKDMLIHGIFIPTQITQCFPQYLQLVSEFFCNYKFWNLTAKYFRSCTNMTSSWRLFTKWPRRIYMSSGTLVKTRGRLYQFCVENYQWRWFIQIVMSRHQCLLFIEYLVGAW